MQRTSASADAGYTWGKWGLAKIMNGGRGESCPRPSLPFFPFSNYSFPISHHCRQTVDVEDERVDGGGVRMREDVKGERVLLLV